MFSDINKLSDKNKNSPYDDAGFLSRLFFVWVTPIFCKAYNKVLQEDEIFDISYKDSSARLTNLFQKAWSLELNKKNPSLLKTMMKLYWRRYLLLGILILFENLLNLTQPIIIWKLLEHAKNIDEKLTESFIYASALIATVLLLILIRNPYYFYTLKMGLQLKIGIGGMVYHKILKLNQKALTQTTTGYIINLLSNDVQRFEYSMPHLHYLWIGPIVTVISIALLYFISKEGGMASILIFIILIPAQICFGKIYFRIRVGMSKLTDERIKMVSELVNGMQVVKMYCWESMFIKAIGELRRKILFYNFLRKLTKSFWVSLRFTGGRFVMISFLVSNFVFQTPLTTQMVWVTLVLVNQIRASIVDRFSIGVNHFFDLQVTFLRLQNFLLLKEYQNEIYPISNKDVPNINNSFPSVIFKNVSACWNQDKINENVIRKISFSLKGPQICAIIGEIGSGKSSLFMALLGELPLNKGEIHYEGTLSYASQQPWIFSDTVQKNILFNTCLDGNHLKNILKATTLKQDLIKMHNGIKTLVGEKGVFLSGGQRARISLARAAYYGSDIILLDDPLAAVDAAVSRQIFEECISGFFKNKLVLLITHQLHLLKQVDKIIVLKEGCIVTMGSYDDVIAQGININSFVQLENKNNLIEKRYQRENITSSFTSTLTEIVTWRDSVSTTNYNNAKKDSNVSFGKEYTPFLIPISSDKLTVTSPLNPFTIENNEDILETFTKKDISPRLYWNYLTVGFPRLGTISIFVLYIGTMFIYTFCDIWLSWWTHKMDKRALNSSDFYKDDKKYMVGMIILTMSTFGCGILSVLLMFVITIYSTKALHEKMLNSILYSPINFFYENSPGRILNRFSKDISIADDFLPVTMQDLILTNCLVLVGLGIAFYKNHWSILVIIPLLVIFWALRKSYMNVSSSVKQIEAATRSPLFGHITTTLQGLATIRALQKQEWFTEDYQKKQDRHSKAFFLFMCSSRWFAFRLDEICAIFITIVTYSCVLLLYYKSITPSDFGLLLSYIVGLIGLTQWAVRQSAEVENAMLSILRIYEYIDLTSEKPMVINNVDETLTLWPTAGTIQFVNVNLYYEDKIYILKNINLTICDKEKIGIVGRTGAGKSSLISLLFRLFELPNDCGRIFIDQVDISTMGLFKLRNAIAVIPQDPILFMGTIRMNLDPFYEYSDSVLWNVLQNVELSNTIEELPEKLYSIVFEGGTNLSVGQRQLLCMARALLKKTRIIVIDEATANVDQHTDHLIQSTLRSTFADCTVLTIAHRINTIIDSDKIIVINNGVVEEFDHPHNIFKNYPTSAFSQMVKQTGEKEEQRLKKIAEDNFLKKEKQY